MKPNITSKAATHQENEQGLAFAAVVSGADMQTWLGPQQNRAMHRPQELHAMNVRIRSIFDGLERRDGATMLSLSAIYFPLLAGSVCLMLVQVYARMGAQRCWRA
jgi:hypothetical protein